MARTGPMSSKSGSVPHASPSSSTELSTFSGSADWKSTPSKKTHVGLYSTQSAESINSNPSLVWCCFRHWIAACLFWFDTGSLVTHVFEVAAAKGPETSTGQASVDRQTDVACTARPA